MVLQPPFEGAVLYCARRDVQDAIRESLKNMGVASIEKVGTALGCLAALEKNTNHLLVIDWEVGPTDLVKILEALISNSRIEIRPILLMVKELSPVIIATGIEYSVTQILEGAVSLDRIKDALKKISKIEKENAPIKLLLKEVSEARQKNEWEKAQTLLENMKAKLPDNPRISVELAENMIRESKWDEAANLVRPFATSKPVYARALHVLGRCYMHSGDFKEATEVLSQAKLLNPNHVERLVDLGNSLLETAEIGKAKSIFAEARAIDSKNQEARIGEGKCLLVEGDVNEALVLFKGISDPRELASIFNLSAVLSMRMNKFQEALKLYDSACDAIGENNHIKAKLVFNKGLAYRRKRMPKEALVMFEEALVLDHEFQKAARNIQIVKEQLAPGGGKKKAAKSPLEKTAGSEVAEADHGGVQSALEIGFESNSADDDFEDDFEDESIAFV